MDTQEPALRRELQCAHCELQCSRTSRQYCAGGTCNVWKRIRGEKKKKDRSVVKYALQMEVKERTPVPFEESVKFSFCALCDVGLPLRGVWLCSPGDSDWTGMHVQKRYNRRKRAKIYKILTVIISQYFCIAFHLARQHMATLGNISGCRAAKLGAGPHCWSWRLSSLPMDWALSRSHHLGNVLIVTTQWCKVQFSFFFVWLPCFALRTGSDANNQACHCSTAFTRFAFFTVSFPLLQI